MKLLYCGDCSDLFRLQRQALRSCYCGKSSGSYTSTGPEVEISGPCMVVAFDDTEWDYMLIDRLAAPDRALTIKAYIPALGASIVKSRSEYVMEQDGEIYKKLNVWLRKYGYTANGDPFVRNGMWRCQTFRALDGRGRLLKYNAKRGEWTRA